jgi:competence protein ComEA
VILLLLLGALRHRLAPWLAGVARPPAAVMEAIAAIPPERFGKVNLNTATADELAGLMRIGPALAARIVADRMERGPFATVEDLDRVKGIGPGILAAIRDEVTAGPANGDSSRAE